jgi:hypothetical protein
VLHLPAARRIYFRTVAFRHTHAMLDVISLRSDLDVENVNPESRQRPNERLEDSALGRQSKFDEGKRSIRALHERHERLGNAQHDPALSTRHAITESRSPTSA